MPGRNPPPAPALLTTPLDALWRLSTRRHTAAALALVAALAIALGLALPQAPAGTAGDPQSLARWLAEQELRRGGWVRWPARLGLFTLYDTAAFRLIWAAVGLGALVAAADGLLTRRAVSWRLVAHVGLLAVLSAGLVEEQWGWVQERTILGPGRPVAVGPPGSTVSLGREAEAGEPPPVVVAWPRGAGQVQARLERGRPLAMGAVTLHLRHAGLAVQVWATDGAGRRIDIDDPAGADRLSEAVLRFGPGGESRYLGVPACDWLIRVTGRTDPTSDSPFHLWVYRPLQPAPLAETALSTEGSLSIGEHRLFWQVLPYAEVRAGFHPGLPLGLAGWLLLGLGLGGALWGRGLGQGRLRWLWAPASLLVGGAVWLLARGLRPEGGGLIVGASALLLAWAAGLFLLAASAGLLERAGRRAPAIAGWPQALGWAALAWTAGLGLAVLSGWVAEGALWRWEPRQAGWALGWCLAVGAWHGWGRERN